MPPIASALNIRSVTKSLVFAFLLVFGLFFCGSSTQAQSINADTFEGHITACEGVVSVAPRVQKFSVTGNKLDEGVLVSAPANFEVAPAANGPYQRSFTIPNVGVVRGTVYVRSSTSARAGNISGNVILSSPGAAGLSIPVNGRIIPYPLVSSVFDQSLLTGKATLPVNFTGTGPAYTWTNDHPEIGLAANGMGNIPAFITRNNTGASITATVTVTPKPAPLIYVPNFNSNTVTVIDQATNAVVSTIPVGVHPHKTLVSLDGNYVFVTNSGDATVSVIDVITQTVIKNITVDQGMFDMALSVDGRELYVATNFTNRMFVINTERLEIGGYVWIGMGTEKVLTHPGGKRIFMDSPFTYETITFEIPVQGPSTNVYVPLDKHARFNTTGSLLYTADTVSKIFVVDANTIKLRNTINVASIPFVFHPTLDDKFIYITYQKLNYISVVNAATGAIVTNIPSDPDNRGLTTSPDGKYMYVLNYNGKVTVIDLVTNKIDRIITYNGKGNEPVLNADGSRLYIPDAVAGKMHVINTATDQVIEVATGDTPLLWNSSFHPGIGCLGTPISFHIRVNPPPSTLTATTATGEIQACHGTASSGNNLQQFTVTGADLSGNIKATAPAGFEVSLSNEKGFSSSIDIPQVSGLANAIVYVRASATPGVGGILGDVTLSTGGSADKAVRVTATINALPVVNKINDQKVVAGNDIDPVNFTGTGDNYVWTNDHPEIGLTATGAGNIAAFKPVNKTGATLTATITVTPKPADYVYLSGAAGVHIVNMATNESTPRYAGNDPRDAALVTPDGKYVFSAGWGAAHVAVIDPVSKLSIKIIPVRANPMGMVLSRDGSRLYVSSETTNDITVINTQTLTVEKYIPIGIISTTVIISPDGKYLFAGMRWTRFKTAVVNLATDQVEATLDASLDDKAGFSADGSSLYSTDKDAKLYVIPTNDPQRYKTMNTTAGGMQMCLTADGKFVYVTHTALNYISVFSTTTGTLTTNIPSDWNNEGIAASPDGKYMYVVNHLGKVFMIDVATHTVKQTFNFRGGEIIDAAVSPDGARVYIPDIALDRTYFIDVAAGTTSYVVSPTRASVRNSSFRMGTGCVGQPVTFKITVEPPPSTLITSAPVGNISTCPGTASSDIIQFKVTGKDLTGDIKAIAPPGFEVSLSKTKDFADSVKIPQINGAADVAVYVRASAKATTGNLSANVVLSTGGSANVNVVVAAAIQVLPVVNPVADQKLRADDMTAAVKFTGTGSSYSWTNDNTDIGLQASGSGDIGAFKATNTKGVTITGNITVTPKPVANLYVLESSTQSLAVINTTNFQTVATIKVGNLPRRTAFNKDRKHIYVANLGSNSVSLIDAVENKLIRTYTGIDEPVDVWVMPDESKMYVSNRQGNALTTVDMLTGNIINVMPVKSEQNYFGVMSPDASRLYLSGVDNVTVVNTNTDLVERVIPVPDNYIGNVLLSPDGGRLYVPVKSGKVVVIDTKTNTVTTAISVAPDLVTLYMSPDGSRLYITSGYGGHVYVIDTSNNKLIGDIDIGAEVSSVLISADGKWLYINSYYHDHLTIVNTTNNSLERVSTGAEQTARGVLSNDGQRWFVAGGNGIMVAVDLLTKKVVARSTSSGNILSMGAELGCIGDPVSFKITVEPPPPSITAAGSLSAMRTIYGTPSQVGSVSVSGISLADGILVTPPAGFEVSLDNVTFGKTVKAGAAGNVGPLKVYIRLAATTNVGSNYTGDLKFSSTNIADVKVSVPVSIVDPAPLTIEGTFTKAYGDNAPDHTAPYNAPNITFTITGLKNGETFKSVDVSYGSFGAPAAAVNTYNNAVLLKNFVGDNGFLLANYKPDYKLSVLKITPAPLTITANNINKYYGEVLTSATGSTAFTVTGLKNNEKVGTVDITYGTGSAATDVANTYPGSVKASNAKGGTFSASNYTITYKDGNINVQTPPPAIVNVISRPSGVNTIYGDASAASSFSISGTYLPGPVTVTPPAGFEVSADGITYGSTANVGNLGTVNNVPVYIRLAGQTNAGPYSGNINLKADLTTVTVSMPTSTVSPRMLTLKAADDTRTYGTALANYIGAQRYTIVSGTLKNGNTIGTVAITYQTGKAANSAVNIYKSSATLGTVTGANGYLPGNYTINPEAGDVIINQAPLTITANAVTKVYGETISGKMASTAFTPVGLQNGETIISITTNYTAGAAANANAGTYAGAITPSDAVAGTFTAANYKITYLPGNIVVNKATLTVKAENKKRTAGTDNPVFTFGYSGFVNNENEAQISVKPVASTTASIWSQAGTYPITLSGGSANNYNFAYVNGLLTVEGLKIFTPATLGLPNAFTPNNDNINDTWNLAALSAYPKCTINIFDRYGRQLFSTTGYAKAWDGKHNGADLPTGVYYYVIDLKNGEKPVGGNVTLIR